jgi:predicted GNAT superfamily acetyltransferase
MIEIRQLTQYAEFEKAVALQQEIWGYTDVELLPLRLFVVADKIGGQVLGAFDNSRMVAFCLAIPGLKAGGKYYLHSHMLGVLPAYRNTGLGRQMKLKQRQEALARGIALIEWTFDPLELKNAYLNIERLGVIVRRFVHNQYGATTSHLHGGLPTDRCTAEWWLASERATAAEANRTVPRGEIKHRIEVPADIAEIRRSDPAHARELQTEIGAKFDESFSAGLAVIGFERTDVTGSYLLGPWELK